METLMAIIFFIMFLIILGIFIYFIYDYMTYKDVVDKTVLVIRDTINTSNMIIKGAVENTKSEIRRLDKNIETEKLRNESDNDKLTTIESNLSKFDTNLKKYFQFTSNNTVITDKLYQYNFDPEANGTDYKVNLMKRINAVSGITIGRDQDLQICNAYSNCVKLSVNDEAFDIKTVNNAGSTLPVQYMQIRGNNGQRTPFARFNMQERNVYLGGIDENNSPIYTQGYQAYANENTFNIKPRNSMPYTMRSIREGSSNLVDWVDKLGRQNTVEHASIHQALQAINNGLYGAYSNIEAIASYSLTFGPALNIAAPLTSARTNILTFNIVPLHDITVVTGIDTSLLVSMPASIFGMNNANAQANTTNTPTAVDTILNISTGSTSEYTSLNNVSYTFASASDIFRLEVKLTKSVPRGILLTLNIIGNTATGDAAISYPYGISVSNNRPISGVVFARIVNNNYSSTYPPNIARTNINTYANQVTSSQFYPSAQYTSRVEALQSPFQPISSPVLQPDTQSDVTFEHPCPIM